MNLGLSELKKQIVISARHLYDRARRHIPSRDSVFLVVDQDQQQVLQGLQERFEFYLPGISIEVIEVGNKKILISKLLSSLKPALLWANSSAIPPWLVHGRGGFYNINYETNPTDGWEWAALANWQGGEISPTLKSDARQEAHLRFKNSVAQLKRTNGFHKTYIFGTGPSLANAAQRDWPDGYRIVCNTVVRDPLLWDHLKPHMIVASDAIYHFGHTAFAKAFRRDLKKRLMVSDAYFVFPDHFLEIVQREFQELQSRLLPIPYGESKVIGKDLTLDFSLPSLGNVLPLVLLPLACTFSKEIYLWGFDGRAPSDDNFWSNSEKHHYSELMGELKKAHPRFYSHFVPKNDPLKYVRETQGEGLELALQEAEVRGWQFKMMHRSWTPVLQSRQVQL